MHRDNVHKYRALLEAGRWFHGVPDGLKEALLDVGSLRSFSPGQRLFAQGDAANGMFAVLQGAIRISSTAPSGEEALLTLVEPPNWLGEIAVLDGKPRSHHATAATECLLVHVLQSHLESILEAEPSYWRDLGVLVSGKLRLTFVAMEDNTVQPIAVRLTHRLVLMAESHGEWRDRSSRVIEASQAQLARMLSISRQTVNQVLKNLEADGVLRLSYGRIEIVDLDSLRERASGKDPGQR